MALTDLPKQLRQHAEHLKELSSGPMAHIQPDTCKSMGDTMEQAADALEGVSSTTQPDKQESSTQ